MSAALPDAGSLADISSGSDGELSKPVTGGVGISDQLTGTSQEKGVKRLGRQPKPRSSASPSTVTYKGSNIYHAAAQGNLPLVVLLWGMAAARNVDIMQPDGHGNNPCHFASTSETPEARRPCRDTLTCSSCFLAPLDHSHSASIQRC